MKHRTICFLFTALLTVSLFASCQKETPALSVPELLNLGEKYLLELDYEQSLVQFLQVMEIEPMNPRGYTGSAEAYIGLDNIEEALATITQGLEWLPEDASLQEMQRNLLALSGAGVSDEQADHAEEEEPENLTGREPFSEKDLEDWGFPQGLSIWDVQEKLGLDTDDINRAIQGLAEDHGQDLGWYPQISPPEVENVRVGLRGNGRLCSVQFSGPNPFIPTGPRGIQIGMGVDEVMRLFMVQNPEALKFAQSPSLEGVSEERPFLNHKVAKEMWFPETFLIYQGGDSWQHARISTGTKNGELYFIDLSYSLAHNEINCLPDENPTQLSCWFSPDGILEDIIVWYN